MNSDLSADKPVSTKIEDRFQRYDFAKRVADTIASRKNQSCIVVGIYGAWGEGKTSLINFIEEGLREHEDILCIKFNAWRYEDENTLLLNFYKEISISIETKLKKVSELIGKSLKKYGKLAPFSIFGFNVGTLAKDAGELMDGASVEELKDRLSQGLKEYNKNLVIFIDDIDRLDKAEIYSLLRLVKLNADFENTTYVLSFDLNMVSAAIGERFGKSDQESGKNFLEKIIQVPIQIPPVHPRIITDHCYNILSETLSINNIRLSEEEEKRFLTNFQSLSSTRLNTPRLSVRYNNSVYFSIPLLNGEVNTVDLLLIEGVKLFYPEHYDFIRNNRSYFTKSDHDNHTTYENDNIDLDEIIDEVKSVITKREKSFLLPLLLNIFPHLEKGASDVENMFILDQETDINVYKNKRISSESYFDKYFTFSVLKGEISDLKFNRLITISETHETKEISNLISNIIENSSPRKFLYKLSDQSEHMPWNSFTKMINSISPISHLFLEESKISGSLILLDSLATIISKKTNSHSIVLERYTFLENLIQAFSVIPFGFKLMEYLLNQNSNTNILFDENQKIKLFIFFKDKILVDSGKVPFYKYYSQNTRFIIFVFMIWSRINKIEVNEYIKNILELSSNNILDFIWSFVDVLTYDNSRCEKHNLSEETYRKLTKITNIKYLHLKAIELLNSEIIQEEVKFIENYQINMPYSVKSEDYLQNKMNVLRQLEFWYKNDSTTE